MLNIENYNRSWNLKKSLLNILTSLLPFVLIFAVIIGILISYYIGKPELIIKGSAIAVPAIISSYVIKNIYRNNFKLNASIEIFSANKNIKLLFILLYIISIIILLTSPERTKEYFGAIIGLYALVFIQIFTRGHLKSQLILIEIMAIMINLIYSVTLKYPMYFGGVDTFAHMFFSEVIYISGHTVPEKLDAYYSHFPLYHILIAESSYILGLSIKESLFLITAPIYTIIVVFIYYIFNHVTNNKQILLLTCMIYSTMTTVINYGSYMVTRTMAFVGFIMILYLAYSSNPKKHKIISKIIIIIMSIFLVLVHQVSIVQILILLFVLLGCEWIVDSKKYLNLNLFVLLNVMYISYWFYIAYIYTNDVLATRIQPQLLDSTKFISSIQPIGLWTSIIEKVDSSIFLFFALIAIGYILWNNKKNYLTVYALFSLLTLILFVPSPLQIFWQTMNLWRFDRFELFLGPFMAFIMAYGFYVFHHYLSKKYNSSYTSILLFISIFLFVFVSLMSSTTGSENLWRDSSREYFNEEELQCFNFISAYIPYGSSIYSDEITRRYFTRNQYGYNFSALPYYSSNIIKDVDSIPMYKGYKIIRSIEYLRYGLLFGEGSFNVYLYPNTRENEERLVQNMNKNNKLYSNYDISIYSGTPQI